VSNGEASQSTDTLRRDSLPNAARGRSKRAYEALRCPRCQGAVRMHEHAMECTSCAAKLPMTQGVLRCVDEDDFYEEAYLNRINHLPGTSKLKDWVFFNLLQCGVFGELRQVLRPDALVLDIGCASGVRWLGQYHTIGVDLSYGSLRGVTEFYELAIQASAQELPLASESVDAVYSSFFFEHVPPAGKDACIEEFGRCLKPGGYCVFLFDVLSDGPFGRLARRDPEAFHRGFVANDGHVGLEPMSQAIKRFEAAGLNVRKTMKFGATPLQYMASYQWLDVAYGDTSPSVRLLGTVAQKVSSSRYRVPVDLAIAGFDRLLNPITRPDGATRAVIVAQKPDR
jgi:SAM-dependent methyltransferase